MTRLAFLSDAHVDDYRHSVDPASGLNRGFADSLDILRWVAQDAAERGCEALVFCGDMTEQRHPAPWRVALIREALAAFPRAVHLLRGNHDGEKGGRSIVDVLAGGDPAWYGHTRPEVAVVGDVAIAFMPWMDRHWLRAQDRFADVPDADVFRVLAEQYLAIARGLYVEAADLAEQQVLAVHATLSGGRMSEAQQAFLGDMNLVVDTGALAAIGFDAVLAGHLHRHQILNESPFVAYIGSPHRVDWGEEHDGAKGYVVLDTAAHAIEFVETPCRRFVTVDYAAETADMASWEGAVVRAVNVEPGIPVDDVVTGLLQAGAVEVTEVRHQRVEAPSVEPGRLNETQSAEEALEAYLEDDEDREALLDRGRAVLAEVA